MRWMALAAALFLLVLARGQAPTPSGQLVFLAVLAVVLEIMAVPLTGVGFFSSAFGPIFALALMTGAGPAAAAVVLLAGVGVRSLLYARSHAGPRTLHEALADLLPALAALAAVAWLTPAGGGPLAGVGIGLLAYLPLALVLPDRMLAPWEKAGRGAWERHRELTSLYVAGVAGLGPALALLFQAGSWNGLWLCPLLLGLHRAAQVDLLRLDLLDRERLELRAQQSREALQVTQTRLSQTQSELGIESQERKLLQELIASMAGSPDLESLLALIGGSVRKMVRCQSVLIFLKDDAVPPGSIVERCWQSGKVTPGQGMKAEAVAAALPMEGEGVLYVGRQQTEFSWEERHYLVILAGAGGLGIQSVRRFEEERRAQLKLRVWVQRQAYLLEGARVLAAGLAREEILERLRGLVQDTIPHERGAFLEPDRGQIVLSWPESFQLEPAARQAASSAARQGVPVTQDSLLAVPLIHEFKVVGVVVLHSSQGFSSEQADVLQTLAYQAAVALDNAATHRQLKLSQAQMVQSSKMAAVGQLAAGVAHELNNPLGAVVLALEGARVALDTGKLERIGPKLDICERGVGRCQEIVSKLLYSSRGGEAVTASVTRLNVLLQDTLTLLGPQLVNQGIELVSTNPPDLPRVAGASNELQQVITSLLQNAGQAALDPAASSRQVRLSTRAEGGMVVLRVEDDGPGIPPEIRERIFEPFFTTRPPGQGTGLGLTLSLQIAQACGGSLQLVPGTGSGAIFELVLPALTTPN
ncbi:MAG: hypothetical protein AMXMBFR33_08230 [Candidatus Xenobia bacterium]